MFMKRISVRLAKEPSAKGAAPALRAHLDIVVGKRSPSPRPHCHLVRRDVPVVPSPVRDAIFVETQRTNAKLRRSDIARACRPAGALNKWGGDDYKDSAPTELNQRGKPKLNDSGAGVREFHLSSTTLKRCASSQEEACRSLSPSFPGAWLQAGMSPRPWRSTNK